MYYTLINDLLIQNYTKNIKDKGDEQTQWVQSVFSVRERLQKKDSLYILKNTYVVTNMLIVHINVDFAWCHHFYVELTIDVKRNETKRKTYIDTYIHNTYTHTQYYVQVCTECTGMFAWKHNFIQKKCLGLC